MTELPVVFLKSFMIVLRKSYRSGGYPFPQKRISCVIDGVKPAAFWLIWFKNKFKLLFASKQNELMYKPCCSSTFVTIWVFWVQCLPLRYSHCTKNDVFHYGFLQSMLLNPQDTADLENFIFCAVNGNKRRVSFWVFFSSKNGHREDYPNVLEIHPQSKSISSKVYNLLVLLSSATNNFFWFFWNY